MNYAAVANLPFADFTSRVWPCHLMASGGRMSYGVDRVGYAEAFQPKLDEQRAKGWSQVMVEHPWGCLPTGAMTLTAAAQNLFPRTRDFEKVLWANRDITALVYVGSFWDEFIRKVAHDPTRLFSLWRDSFRSLPSMAHVSLGIDHSATLHAEYATTGGYAKGFPPTYWEWAWGYIAGHLRPMKLEQGQDVYLEALPYRSATHQIGHNFICSTFRKNGTPHSEWMGNAPADDENRPPLQGREWALPSQKITGRVIDKNTLLGRGDSLEVYAAAIADVLARGHDWAGPIQLRPESAAKVHEAVVAYASRMAGGDT